MHAKPTAGLWWISCVLSTLVFKSDQEEGPAFLPNRQASHPCVDSTLWLQEVPTWFACRTHYRIHSHSTGNAHITPAAASDDSKRESQRIAPNITSLRLVSYVCWEPRGAKLMHICGFTVFHQNISIYMHYVMQDHGMRSMCDRFEYIWLHFRLQTMGYAEMIGLPAVAGCELPNSLNSSSPIYILWHRLFFFQSQWWSWNPARACTCSCSVDALRFPETIVVC